MLLEIRDCLLRTLLEYGDRAHGVVVRRVIRIESKSLAHRLLGFREKVRLQAQDTKVVRNRSRLRIVFHNLPRLAPESAADECDSGPSGPILPHPPGIGRNTSGSSRTKSVCCSGVSIKLP